MCTCTNLASGEIRPLVLLGIKQWAHNANAVVLLAIVAQ